MTNPMNNEHEPNCASRMICAVYHLDGKCNGFPCNCKLSKAKDNQQTDLDRSVKKIRDELFDTPQKKEITIKNNTNNGIVISVPRNSDRSVEIQIDTPKPPKEEKLSDEEWGKQPAFPKEEGWEERFDAELGWLENEYSNSRSEVKDFIRQELQETKSTTRRESYDLGYAEGQKNVVKALEILVKNKESLPDILEILSDLK